MPSFDTIILVLEQVALITMVVLMVPATYRVWVGPSPSDRLQAIDALTTLLIGVVVMLTVVQQLPFYLDVGIALAALSFIGTVAIARYLTEGRVF